MPLAPLVIPVAAKTAIQTYLRRREATTSASPARLLLPHRLYRYLGEQRDGKAQLEDIEPAGWRSFSRTPEGAFLIVDAFETQGTFAFRVHSGRNTERWTTLIRSVRRKHRWDNDSYSMRTLIAPATYSSALWFAGARGHTQLFALNWNADGVAGRWVSAPEWETAVGRATSHAVELWRGATSAEAPSSSPYRLSSSKGH
jgi:hypothetical protein